MENELKQHSNDCFVADSKGLNITQSKHDKRACTKCGEIKNKFSDFYKKGVDRWDSQCKVCILARKKGIKKKEKAARARRRKKTSKVAYMENFNFKISMEENNDKSWTGKLNKNIGGILCR